MTLKLTLEAPIKNTLLPINYQYPLSAAIYKIMQQGDEDYSAFLHDHGYTQSGSLKTFKLFCFSDIKTPFKILGDRLQLLTQRAELSISFHLPEAAEHFVKGLFSSQTIEIADRKSRTAFAIIQIEVLPSLLTNEDTQELILHPMSPIVCGKKNHQGNYNFLSPTHPDFLLMLLHNWKAKYQVIYGPPEHALRDAKIELLPLSSPPKSRLVTIKDGTPQATKIRGFVKFELKVKGSRSALELLLNSGVGLYNSQGMGYVS